MKHSIFYQFICFLTHSTIFFTKCLNKLTIGYAWQINVFRFIPLASCKTFVKVACLPLNRFLKFVEFNVVTVAHLWPNHDPQSRQACTPNFAKLSCRRRRCCKTNSQRNRSASTFANYIGLNEFMSIYLIN